MASRYAIASSMLAWRSAKVVALEGGGNDVVCNDATAATVVLRMCSASWRLVAP